jgi:hypothetical protein
MSAAPHGRLGRRLKKLPMILWPREVGGEEDRAARKSTPAPNALVDSLPKN